MRIALFALSAALLFAPLPGSAAGPPAEPDVLKATLANGLRVVIVRNPIAAVASTTMTYLVGSRDDPPDMPGMAHAQEHMMFRGTKTLATAQLGTIATALGGAFNAQTGDTTTAFHFTIPAADLDVVLRIEADRMVNLRDAQSEWTAERGAIEQEVAQHDSTPGNSFYREVRSLAFAGTGYQHDGVGTKEAFDRLTGPRLKAFYERWYAPNNAVFVVAGDVDPQRTLAQIRSRFESIPRKAVAPHAHAKLQPVARTVMRRATRLTYSLAALAFRLPGLESPDFLASFVLQGMLDSEAGPLRALARSGEALSAEWDATPYDPEAQLSYALAALPPGGDPEPMVRRLEAILTGYARDGVPRDLFAATKRRLIADQELSRNSIEALATDWSDTIALDGQPSIAREQELIAAVTPADVDRVAKRYFDPQHALVGLLTTSSSGAPEAPSTPAHPVRENPIAAKPATTQLPAWAQPLLQNVSLPRWPLSPTRTRLANGLTLIVQPETISKSVFVYGTVRTNPALQEPPGKEGVAAVLAGIFENGTARRDRAAFQRALDDSDASISGGSDFGLQTTVSGFDRAVALLGENELHPRFDAPTFSVARQGAANRLGTELAGSHSQAMRRAEEKLLPSGDPELRVPTVPGINALSLEDVRNYYARTFRPDLTTIVVVGNVSPGRARAAVEAAFRDWSASGEPPSLTLPPVPLNEGAHYKLALPFEQDIVTLEELVDRTRSDPEVPALQLGNAVLGGGTLGPQQSRLFRDLRQNAGLVYFIDSRLAVDRSRSRFVVEFASAPGNEERIESMVDEEIQRLRREPIGNFELALMKASLVRAGLVRDGAIAAIGGELLQAALDNRPLDSAHTDIVRLLGVDAGAIQRAFNAHIDPTRFVRVIEGP